MDVLGSGVTGTVSRASPYTPVNVQAREGVGERENRQALGTYGAAARAKGVKDRIQTRDAKFGDAAGG
jgi:hypothetical protein